MTSYSDGSSCPVELKPSTGPSNVVPSIEKHQIALLLLLGFGGFSLVIAGLYKSLRKYVFRDEHKLDTVFDAGGRVSLSLTAVTVTSQLLWPADFMYGATLTSKSGLGGSLWTAVGVVVDILLFPTLSIYLKTRAPGAKTFPQIAYARFGKTAHILFCALALLTNIIVTTSVLLSGRSTIAVLGKNSSNEFIMLILAVLCGSYCMIGGLGTTFYISYFNTALTFSAITFYLLSTNIFPPAELANISTNNATYNALRCIAGPNGNFANSLLTFRTRSGLIYGIIVLFMATSLGFCDQANWQSRIAAKPAQGVIGFFFAGYMWFVVPTALSFTITVSYFSMSYKNGTHLLSEAEIDDGYITPFVMQSLLGTTGGYLILTMIMMALMSTGSGEVMAISSIIVYDIYKTYINPFRKHLTPTSCVLCGQQKISHVTESTTSPICQCPSSIDCKNCLIDIRLRQGIRSSHGLKYTCTVHGEYRHYEDHLLKYKSWCMVWIVVMIVPYGLVISESGINVNWATLGIPVLTGPILVPLFLTITWAKATAKGVVSGSISGLLCSLSMMMVVGSMYEGGLTKFFVNTAEDYSILCSMVSGVFLSAIISIVVSLCTHTVLSKEDEDKEWSKTINIDNPLNPFKHLYEEELKEIGSGPIITTETMERIFRKAKLIALVGASASLVLFVIIVPSVALSYEVLTYDEYSILLRVFQVWVFIGTVLVVVVPPVEEGLQIWRTYKKNKDLKMKQTLSTYKCSLIRDQAGL